MMRKIMLSVIVVKIFRKKGIIYNLQNTLFEVCFMFAGICTLISYIFVIFEWQKAFLTVKIFASLSCVSVAQW